uniref:X-box-binding protein 1 n=1 Tax=Anopheles quadriannulatus TaxID=34691 RepID=A0A182X0U0_ANOQN
MATPIFITVPTKYIPINVAPAVVAKPPTSITPVKPLAKRPASVAPSSVASDDESSSMDEFIVRGKKRRLDHLTWEEKIQRKKLKNRVAAQTSRDRKKAKMEEMEKTIQEQSEQIEQLQNRCSALDTEKSSMYDKYLDLERRFEDLQKRLLAQELQQQQQHQDQKVKQEPQEDDVVKGSVGCVTAGRQTGSAASPRCPQQQGLYKCGPAEAQTTLPSTASSDPRLAALWKIIAICLLYKTCSKISTCPSSKSLPKACSQVSAQTWKTLIEQAARLMPKATAPASACLDQWWGPQQNSWNPTPTGNRLILTTHNYSKSPFYEHSDAAAAPAQPPVVTIQPKRERDELEGSIATTLQLHQPAPILPNGCSDTLYGTYDNETNCITIVLAGDQEQVSETTTVTCMEDDEAVALSEELVLVDQQEQQQQQQVELMEENCPTSALPSKPFYPLAPITIRPPSPLQDLLSPIAPQPLKSPGGFSSVSDAGYESVGSPTSASIACDTISPTDPSTMSLDYELSDDFNTFWNLDPLFPILE